MPQGNLIPPNRPRHTEDAARPTLSGLMGEILGLMRSDDPQAWGRIALIGSEIAFIGQTVERELLRRQKVAPAPQGVTATVVLHVAGV